MQEDCWFPEFIDRSPAYKVFSWLPSSFLIKKKWPELVDYNNLQSRATKLTNHDGIPIQFIEQSTKGKLFEKSYEPRIFLTGEIQTRPKNWHDFFNMLVWKTFPLIKSHLNFSQYYQLKQRVGTDKQRSPLENFLTLFDENGIIIVSSNSNLLDLIARMQWKDFFWEKRDAINKELACYVVGHSLHEKFLNPYIGMVGHSLLLKVKSNFFTLSMQQQIYEIDQSFRSLDLSKYTTRSLSPIPVLGFPNWSSQSLDPTFYNNEKYFRKKND